MASKSRNRTGHGPGDCDGRGRLAWLAGGWQANREGRLKQTARAACILAPEMEARWGHRASIPVPPLPPSSSSSPL